jgi:ABC-type transporter Mla subunit MlaD
MHGIEIGKVRAVIVYDDSVEAIFWVKGIRLREGSSLFLEPLNIFGDKELAVYQGEGELLPLYSTIYGVPKSGLSETIVSLGVFLAHLDSLATQMIDLTLEAQKSFDKTTKGLERTISSVEKEVIRTLKSIREITTSTHKMIDKTTLDLTATVENLHSITLYFKTLLTNIDTTLNVTLRSLSRTTARIDTLTSFLIVGKGTAGKLFSTDSLYIEINSMLKSFRMLINDIKENPKRYFGIF